jgi:hypothetical protein
MTVRAKFMLQERHQLFFSDGLKYVFRPVYDQHISEDRRFTQYSPNGEFTIVVDNPLVHPQWELGKQYYFDITPADQPAAEPIPTYGDLSVEQPEDGGPAQLKYEELQAQEPEAPPVTEPEDLPAAPPEVVPETPPQAAPPVL